MDMIPVIQYEREAEERARMEAANAPLPNHLTKRAFQNRFPLSANGVSRKYDAMALFLADDAYASYLVADQGVRMELKLLVQTGLNRLNASAHVDLDMDEAANFTLLLTQPIIPTAFQLTAEERDVILSKVIQPNERP